MSKNTKKPRRRMHPRRMAEAHRKATRYHAPDATERNVQELNRLMRLELKEAPGEDGAVAGPLRVAARHAARQLAVGRFDSDEHRAGIAQWLVGHFGEVIHSFDADAYLAWREDCRQRAADAVTPEIV